MTTPYEPVYVRVVQDDRSTPAKKRRAIHMQTFTLTASDPVQAILRQAANRAEAWVQPLTGPPDITINGHVTGPGAGAFIGTFNTPPEGEYAITVVSYVDGTATAADDDNMRLTVGSSQFPLVGPGASVFPVTTGPIYVRLDGQTQVSVNAIAAGGASAVYHQNTIIHPVGATGDLVIGDARADVQSTVAGAASTSSLSGAIAVIPWANHAPYPLNTTDVVYAGAALVDLPLVLSVVSIYEQDEI